MRGDNPCGHGRNNIGGGHDATQRDWQLMLVREAQTTFWRMA